MAEHESDDSEQYLSPNDIGELAGVTGEAVKQWIYSRSLPASKLPNGYWRVKRSDLDEFLRERKRPSKRRVLVVANDPKVLKAAGNALSPEDFILTVASNRMDALLKAKDAKPAMIFMDLSDSTVEGLELVTRLRATKGFKRLPIVLLATRKAASSVDNGALLSTSAQGMLYKPVTAKAFAAEVARLLPGV